MRWCDESLNRDFRFACHGWPLFIHPRAAEPYTVLTQVGEGAAEAVELPDDEHVARPERAHATVEAAADELRANSGLTSAQYSQPVLGLIFLRFAEVRFLTQLAVLEKQAAGGRRGSRVDDPTAYQAEGILYLTPPARFDYILRLPEGSDVGKAVNKAMRDIEAKNPQLTGVLPKNIDLPGFFGPLITGE